MTFLTTKSSELEKNVKSIFDTEKWTSSTDIFIDRISHWYEEVARGKQIKIVKKINTALIVIKIYTNGDFSPWFFDFFL